MKIICHYLQGTKDKFLLFNLYKKMVENFYVGVDFAGLQGHENPEDPTYANIRTGFVVTFPNCLLLCVSKLHTEIIISTIHSEYVTLSHSIRYFLPL